MVDFLTYLFDTSGFPPRWRCGAWSAGQGWLHILSDMGIWLAYLTIPCVLGYFVVRKKDIPFRTLFLLFGSFILACGTTHLMDAVIFWWPAYRLAGVIKLVTAIVSWATVLALVLVTPKLLTMRSPEELEKEVAARKQAEAALQGINAALEGRVAERTADLAQANAALRASEERLLLAMEAGRMGTCEWNRAGAITTFHPAAERFFGYSAAEVVGQNVKMLMPELYPDQRHNDSENEYWGAEGKSPDVGGEVFGRRKDGATFLMDLAVSEFREGNHSSFTGVMRDLTESKQKEEALARQAKAIVDAQEALRGRTLLLQAIFDSMGEGLVVADETGRLLQWNPAAQQILGLGVRDVVPDRWAMGYGLFLPDQVTPCPPEEIPLVRAIRGQEVDDVELFVRHAELPQGAWVHVTGRPLRDESGSMQGGVVIVRDVTDMKHDQETHAYLAALVESSDDAIISKSLEGTITSWNKGAERIFGYTAKEVIGESLSILIPPERADDLPKIMERIRQGERVENYETVRRRKDGREIMVSLTVSPIRNAAGVVIGASKIARDVTERHRNEKALRESEKRYRFLADAMPQMVWTARPDGALDYYNQRWYDYTGMTFEQIKDWGWQPVLHLDDLENCLNRWQQALRTGENYEVECRFKRACDGAYRWHLGRAFPLRNQEGEIEQWVGTCTDIDDQKRAEAALRVSEERFRRALVDSPFPILLHAEDGEVVQVSDSWTQITGYAREELATVSDWTERAFGNRKTLVQADIDRLYRLDHRIYEGEYAITTRSGEQRIWDFSSAPLGRDPTGRRIVISMAMDVTERKHAEEEVRRFSQELEQRVQQRTAQLEAANKELEAFSYSISHDLRAPLRAIDGFSRILLKEYAAAMPPDAREYLQDIRVNTQQMGHLVDDLLAFSRLSRQAIKKERLSPAKLVRQCLEELRGEQEGRQVEIQVEDLPDCLADPALLKQVWINLLANALKYTSKRQAATIAVGSRSDPDSSERIYFVKDNGVGFDMRYVHKLFGVFQRLHRAEEYEGTGVGLAIVQRIVHRHGGRVWAEAQPDKGASFFFTLGTGGCVHD